MKSILPLLVPNQCLLLTAPTAWGKTSKLLDMIEESKAQWVFFSPLKAINTQVFGRLKWQATTLMPRREDFKHCLQSFLHKKTKCLVVTPEVIPYELEFFIAAIPEKTIFVFDEFHLFYQWGETFRPLLLDLLREVAGSGRPLLGMTATFSPHLLTSWKQEFTINYDHLFYLDIGNFKWKYAPTRCFYWGPLKVETFLSRCLPQLMGPEPGCLLVFCRYRQEVIFWQEYWQRRGLLVLACVGGGVDQFQKQLAECPGVQVIFATTVLGFGVNLPLVRSVILSYRVKNKADWHQMVARGGRQGQAFYLYHRNGELFNSWRQRWGSFFSLALALVSVFFRQGQLWYR